MKIEDLPEHMPDRRGANRNAWTDELCERLRKLHADGVSFTDIAADLGNGLSRNACIGKALRIGLVKRGPRTNPIVRARAAARPKPKPVPQPKKTRSIVAIRGRSIGVVEVDEIEMRPMSAGIPAKDIPAEQRKQLQELRSHDCRWPYGDPGTADFFFCGGTKIPGVSYCAVHARISYRQSSYRGEASA